MVWDDHYGSPTNNFSAEDLEIIVAALKHFCPKPGWEETVHETCHESWKKAFKVLETAKDTLETQKEWENERD